MVKLMLTLITVVPSPYALDRVEVAAFLNRDHNTVNERCDL